MDIYKHCYQQTMQEYLKWQFLDCLSVFFPQSLWSHYYLALAILINMSVYIGYEI